MPIWDGLLTEEEEEVFKVFSWERERPLGKRPAVLVVDVIYAWVGLKPENIVESVKDYRTSCGERGWEGVAHIQQLLTTARQVGATILYTTLNTTTRRGARWATRARDEHSLGVRTPEELEHERIGNTIVKEIEPQSQDVVITKRAASGFLGTSLLTWLNEMDIDTVLVTGTSTSGCVRATVVDAACYGFYVGIVEECCFDRFQTSHKVSLFDMHAKYGGVISLATAQDYLRTQAQPVLSPQKAPAGAGVG